MIKRVAKKTGKRKTTRSSSKIKNVSFAIKRAMEQNHAVKEEEVTKG